MSINKDVGFDNAARPDDISTPSGKPRKRFIPEPTKAMQSPVLERQKQSQVPDVQAPDPVTLKGDLKDLQEKIKAARANIRAAIDDGRIYPGQPFYSLSALHKITGLQDINQTSSLIFSLRDAGFRPVYEPGSSVVTGYLYQPKAKEFAVPKNPRKKKIRSTRTNPLRKETEQERAANEETIKRLREYLKENGMGLPEDDKPGG